MNSIDSLTNYKNNVNSSQTELHSAVYLTFCPNQKNKLHKINFWAVMNCKQTATKLQFIFNNLSNRDELQSSCTTTLRVRRTATTVMENLAAKQKELQVAQHRTAPVKLHDGNAKSKICKKKRAAKKCFYELHMGSYCSSRALSPSLATSRQLAIGEEAGVAPTVGRRG